MNNIWVVRLKVEKGNAFLVYNREEKIWCIEGTTNEYDLFWVTDDFYAETEEQALKDAQDYLIEYNAD